MSTGEDQLSLVEGQVVVISKKDDSDSRWYGETQVRLRFIASVNAVNV